MISSAAFSRIGFLIWIAVVGAALFTAGLHWAELTGDITDRVLATDNLLPMAIAFTLSKFVYELGHGYAIRRWGGEVHDMGVLFIVFMPMSYFDASGSARFPSRWHRVSVGAAGMYFELFLAALALQLWIALEPGLVRSTAYDVLFVASLSTVLFNANPLLRYDGYYILCDLLDSPSPGEYMRDESQLVEIAKIDPLQVSAFLPAEMFNKIRNDTSASVELEAAIGGTFASQVSMKDPLSMPPAVSSWSASNCRTNRGRFRAASSAASRSLRTQVRLRGRQAEVVSDAPEGDARDRCVLAKGLFGDALLDGIRVVTPPAPWRQMSFLLLGLGLD